MLFILGVIKYQVKFGYIEMDPKSSAVLNEVIAKLQGLLGGGAGVASGPK
jgi:hypothetical protein